MQTHMSSRTWKWDLIMKAIQNFLILTERLKECAFWKTQSDDAMMPLLVSCEREFSQNQSCVRGTCFEKSPAFSEIKYFFSQHPLALMFMSDLCFVFCWMELSRTFRNSSMFVWKQMKFVLSSREKMICCYHYTLFHELKS